MRQFDQVEIGSRNVVRLVTGESKSTHPELCLPRAIYLELKDIRIHDGLEWKQALQEQDTDDFRRARHITARAVMQDQIMVFAADGAIAGFSEIASVTIEPIEPGRIGGERRASLSDSVIAERKGIPEEGYLKGEPGRLDYFARDDAPDMRSGEPEALSLQLYLDEAPYLELLDRLTRSAAPLASVNIRILTELFQSEAMAALSSPTDSQDYGLLARQDRGHAYTPARLEWLQVEYQPSRTEKPKATIDEDGIFHEAETASQRQVRLMEKIERRLRDLAIILVVLIIVIAAF